MSASAKAASSKRDCGLVRIKANIPLQVFRFTETEAVIHVARLSIATLFLSPIIYTMSKQFFVLHYAMFANRTRTRTHLMNVPADFRMGLPVIVPPTKSPLRTIVFSKVGKIHGTGTRRA
ncbi:hypothetical protein PoB_007086300 [Plakobranchus ocellatus]|uniref:Uncharacterized protein n=1 Tax=Plakobranchus ocellatus TaxID=259542 RepID=A0AAV4DJ91_9GAST|nr:hypothetical protein PoB_007086300 [Plakobranchus ocellatus]